VPHVPEVLGRRSPHLDILARLGRARNFGIIESLLPSGPMVRLSGPLVASCRRPTSGSWAAGFSRLARTSARGDCVPARSLVASWTRC